MVNSILTKDAAGSELAAQVELDLRFYDRSAFSSVVALDQEGLITLTGFVRSYYARALAYERTRQIPGVREVVDSLQVVNRLPSRWSSGSVSRPVRQSAD